MGKAEERFVVRFDPRTSLPQLFESMRFRGITDEAKILWLNESLEWGALNGQTMLIRGGVTWFDERTPWAVLSVEEAVYNVDVREHIRATGDR